MYKINTVFFEHIRLYGNKIGLLFAIWAMLPMPCMAIIFIPTSVTVALGLIGLIAWLPLGIILFIYTVKESKSVYKHFPDCPARYRFDELVDFDFETVPGKVRCRLASSEKYDKFYTIQAIEYDDVTKVFKFVILGNIIIVPGGATGVYPTLRAFTGVVGAPDSEMLMKLIREHNIKYKPFNREMAYYAAKAIRS